ncbi:MAG: cytochrome c biogenesis CcdA family protein [Candidatus Methylomirabilales bacterium]
MTKPLGRAPISMKRAGPLLASVGALTLIAAGGWYLWDRWVMALLGSLDPSSPLLLAGFGFLAGFSAFFSPCAFSLFPGYISYALTFTDAKETPGARLPSALRLGFASATGALLFFLLIGIGLSVLGGVLSPFLVHAKPILALAIALLGVMILIDRSPNLPLLQALLPASSNPAPTPWKGAFLYGFGYGLASTGCTLPVYMSAIIFPFVSGHTWAGAITFMSFALAMGFLMLAVSLLIGLSRQALIHKLHTSTERLRQIGGITLILVGLYSGYYYLRAGM